MIDLDELRQAIRNMTRRTLIYKVLKEELTAVDHWKNEKRGRHKRIYKRLNATSGR